MNRVYQANRQLLGTEIMVLPIGANGPAARRLSPGPSQEVVNHSPDGFEWGYGGSGPSQLALAILLDVTGNKVLSLHNYQAFKWDFVAKFPHEGWELTEVAVREWLKGRVTP